MSSFVSDPHYGNYFTTHKFMSNTNIFANPEKFRANTISF